MVTLNGHIFFIEDDEFLEKYNDIWSKVSNRHCVKIACIRIFSAPYFPAFELNTERYSVSLRIQSKWGKMRNKKTPNTDNFYSVSVKKE